MKSEATNSPRTSAGISKSLLTPCRRLGLTRRRPTASPLTPLNSPTAFTPSTQEKLSELPNEPHNQGSNLGNSNMSTPPRSLLLPRRQASKKLIAVIAIPESPVITQLKKDPNDIPCPKKCSIVEKEKCGLFEEVERHGITNTNEQAVDEVDEESSVDQNEVDVVVQPTRNNSVQYKTPTRPHKQKSINLKRNCMVVLDNNLLKPHINKNDNCNNTANNLASNCMLINEQKTGDDMSDVDDVPLSEVSKKLNETHRDDLPLSEVSKLKKTQVDNAGNVKKRLHTDLNEDSEFCEKSLSTFSTNTEKNRPLKRSKVTKLDSSKVINMSSSGEMKKNSKEQSKSKSPSIAIGSDSEDEDFHCRKTILVRKSYPKVSLQKAKSTGSITQKDIDDIKIRIRMKQSAHLARSGGQNIEELTELIKRWRKGCQEALMELLEIMKRKVPEKQNMSTEELLKMLNIPPALIQYNLEDDYFVSPD